MEYQEITKTQFKENYNIYKILTSLKEAMEYTKTLGKNGQYAIAFATKKKPEESMPPWFAAFEQRLNTRLENIETRLDKIETRLDKHDEIFRQHGWIQ